MTMQLDNLSHDVLGDIFLFLRIQDLRSVLLANRFLNQIADSETQWRLVRLSLTNSRDKQFPLETWKFNVQMRTRDQKWSRCFMDSEGYLVMNSMGPIIDESGKVLQFMRNHRATQRNIRIANTARPINTRGTTKIDLKVQVCQNGSPVDPTVRSFGPHWVLLGIIDENILRDLYTSERQNSITLGEFQPEENVGYANNGFFSRKWSKIWTGNFYSGDVVTLIADAEYGYEAAKESNWRNSYGLLTCLLNGAETASWALSGIFAKPDARLYFCLQLHGECNESGIVTTIQRT